MDKLLAYLFDSLKAKSPTIAAIVLVVLSGLHAAFTEPQAAELLGEFGAKVGYWVTLTWVALQGARTTQILREQK